MRGQARRLLTNSSLLVVSFLFSLLLSEVLLRLFWPMVGPGHHKLFNQYHPLLGWAHLPNITGTHVTAEYRISESFNSRGIRGPEYSYHKSPNEYRVLILGDSFAEGYGVEFHELFSEVLKANLREAGHRYAEVINAAAGGYSTDQELLFFQSEGKKYHPDLTILMFYANDVWSNNQPKYPRAYKPLFLIQDGKLMLTNVPVPPPPYQHQHSYQNHNDGHDISSFKRTKKWLLDNSHLYTFVSRRIKNVHYLYTLAIKLGLAEGARSVSAQTNAENVPIPDDFRVWKKRYDRDIRDAWKVTETLVKQLKEETMSIGSELLVFYIPPRAAIYHEVWGATKRRYGMSDHEWSIEMDGNELEAICKRTNIYFVNPVELFKTRAEKLEMEGKHLFYIRDGHWNAEGHRLVGEILAKYVRLKYLADEMEGGTGNPREAS